MRLQFYAYRYADAVLEHQHFRKANRQILKILEGAPVPLLNADNLNSRTGGVKRRERTKRCAFFPIDQKALNRHLDREFDKVKWQLQPLVVSKDRTDGPETGLKADYKLGKLQVEVQFGNMARWYTDVFKFQLSYSLGEVDVGVLVVPMLQFANLIDENVANFERVIRELPWAKMSLTLPILVVGIEPKNYSEIEKCYNRAATKYVESKQSEGKTIIPIPFRERIHQVDLPDLNE